MLLLVAIALIGAVASKPQGILPMEYSIVAPNVAPTIFPVPYSTIPAASMPSSIPAVIPASMSGPMLAESMPASTIPVGSIPASTIPVGSIPASTIPVGSIPASTIPVGYIPSVSIPLGSIPPTSIPVGSVPADTVPLASVPAATAPAALSVIQMGQNIIYPSLDIDMASSPLIPKPVEDTPEVKKAKMDLEAAYNKALSGAPESRSLFRGKRELQRVMPYGYNLPYSGYVTPYGRIAVPSSHVHPSDALHAPYFSHV